MRRVRALWCRIAGHEWQPWGQFTGDRTVVFGRDYRTIEQWCSRCPAIRSIRVPLFTYRPRQSSSYPSAWVRLHSGDLALRPVTVSSASHLAWERVSDADTSPSPKAKVTGSASVRNGASR